MDAQSRVPELIVVRVVSSGTQFAVGDDISVAYTTPTLGRLVPHDAVIERIDYARYEAVVPDAFCARVTIGSRTYCVGELLSLSFVDPRFARIHRMNADCEDIEEPKALEIVAVESSVEAESNPPETRNDGPVGTLTSGSPTEPHAGIRVRMEWSIERARRFVQIVDKLFTVDRLGWYRHALAMRLLVPDTIECADSEASVVATGHLQMLRAAAVEALGRPLLAACMPAFTVTAEWLETIDTADMARALAGIRSAITPFACDETYSTTSPIGDFSAVGLLRSQEIRGDAVASPEAFLATLAPYTTSDPLLSQRLRAYREALRDAFAQTARTTELVRLGRMSEPNHVLDDRLWQLAGIVGQTLGGLAVA